MSLDSCKDCGRAVDTDTDDMAYIVTLIGGKEHNTGVCRCKNCRDDVFLQIGETNKDIKRNLDAMTSGSPEWLEQHKKDWAAMRERWADENRAPDERAAMMHETV